MSKLARVLMVLAFVLMPSAATLAQSTPEAVDGQDGPFAFGLNQPAVYVDERDNPVFEVTVTGIELDWEAPEETWPPERGQMYVAVHLSVTNLGNRPVDLNVFSFTLIDSMGYPANIAWLSEIENQWIDLVPIDGGEEAEGFMIFTMYSDLEPMLLMFQPDYTGYVFIYLNEGEGN